VTLVFYNIIADECLIVKLSRHFPGEIGVLSSEVTICGSLLHDGSSEVKISDDGTGTQVEVGLNDLCNIGIALSRSSYASSISIYENR